MKYLMDALLRFEVEIEYENVRDRYPKLKAQEIVAGILSKFEGRGHASRYVRKDGRIGWRATDKLRQDLFEQEQDAIE
jgi:hypothetical protein